VKLSWWNYWRSLWASLLTRLGALVEAHYYCIWFSGTTTGTVARSELVKKLKTINTGKG